MVHEALPDIQLVDIVAPVLRGLDKETLRERGGLQVAQKCKYCKLDATVALVWADGRAYIPVCDEHKVHAREIIVKRNHDSVDRVVNLPIRASDFKEAFHIRGTHWVRVPASGTCPAEFPMKAQFPGRQQTVCFTRASALSAAQARQRRSEQAEPPKNPLGLTVRETLESAGQQGRKFSKAEANFRQGSPSPERACGTCRFFLRDPASEIGLCQVVEGPIPWFSTSDLFISAEDEAEFAFEAAQLQARSQPA